MSEFGWYVVLIIGLTLALHWDGRLPGSRGGKGA